MSRSEFWKAIQDVDVYMASLMANMAGVSLAQVQLWVVQFNFKGKHHGKV